jgi:ribosome biogenesis GTPase / thiamine phosphate phosphatase
VRLADLGWDNYFEIHFDDESPEGCVPARVAEESKGFYRVMTESGELRAQVAGRVRYRAEERANFPAVGDWVAAAARYSERAATITAILPRRTMLSRKSAGHAVEEQILAANLDVVFVVASLNREFNLRRIERYLAMAWESGARPVVLLNKSDICPDASRAAADADRVAPGVAIHALSAQTGQGVEAISQYLTLGRTAAFIGSSGVGKSTIINALMGSTAMRVKAVRRSDDRGRHTTTSRQMIVLPNGGIVVDTPGMRELGLWDSDAGLAQAFDDLESLAERCRFRDCRHQSEPGCVVIAAVEEGKFERGRYENYLKLQAELKFIESKTDAETRSTLKKRARQACKDQKMLYRER